MADQYVLALDQGTTSSRAILFDRSTRVVAVSQMEFPQYYPRPGWVEHDPAEIWESQLTVMRDAVSSARIGSSQIASIGITNQRETTLVWNRATGEPVHNAIVWQCRRTAGKCDELKTRGLADEVRSRTGLVVDAYFSGTKLAWILENVAGSRDAAERGELAFGTVDTWLLWKLTNGAVHATDVTNAARTMLFNIHSLDWDDELLGMLEIPRSLLPSVRPSSGEFGVTDRSILGEPIPINGVAGDQHAALFGQACFKRGMVKNTYGTGCFLLTNTGNDAVESAHQLLTTPAWATGAGTATYALEGSVFIAGAAVQWLRDSLLMIGSAPETEEIADRVADTGGVYVVPAFVGLGAPYWDSYARGGILGLTAGAGRDEIVRATLEAIAYQTRDVVDSMSNDCSSSTGALRVDGGASANNFLMQFQADILGLPVERPVVAETTALGAAYLAGLAVGYWTDQDELAAAWRLDRRFEPRMSEDQRETLYSGWQEAVRRVAGWGRPERSS